MVLAQHQEICFFKGHNDLCSRCSKVAAELLGQQTAMLEDVKSLNAFDFRAHVAASDYMVHRLLRTQLERLLGADKLDQWRRYRNDGVMYQLVAPMFMPEDRFAQLLAKVHASPDLSAVELASLLNAYEDRCFISAAQGKRLHALTSESRNGLNWDNYYHPGSFITIIATNVLDRWNLRTSASKCFPYISFEDIVDRLAKKDATRAALRDTTTFALQLDEQGGLQRVILELYYESRMVHFFLDHDHIEEPEYQYPAYPARMEGPHPFLARAIRRQMMLARWRRVRRLARLAGLMCSWYTEVCFRPQHSGAKRCREHFEGLADADGA